MEIRHYTVRLTYEVQVDSRYEPDVPCDHPVLTCLDGSELHLVMAVQSDDVLTESPSLYVEGCSINLVESEIEESE